MVEFAILLPLFLLLVFGTIEFGNVYNNYISLRQGTREAARQGAVANFGPAFTTGSPCNLTVSASNPSADIKNLMCLAKNQIGLDSTKVRVQVLIALPDFSAEDTAWNKGDGLIVCAQYPVSPITGLFSSFLGGKMLRTKTTIRIEQTSFNAETDGFETPPPGGDWSWCTVSSSTP